MEWERLLSIFLCYAWICAFFSLQFIRTKQYNLSHRCKTTQKQSYTFVLKRIYRDQRFRNHPKNRKKAIKTDMMNCYPFLKRYFYNVVVLPIRFIPSMNLMLNASVKVKNAKSTNLVTKSPLYALPQVSFLVPAISEMNRMGIPLRRAWNRCIGWWEKVSGDWGYRGTKEINGTQILIPDAPKAKDTYYQRKKKHKLFCKRQE